MNRGSLEDMCKGQVRAFSRRTLFLLGLLIVLLVCFIIQNSTIFFTRLKFKKSANAYELYRYGKFLAIKNKFKEAEDTLKKALSIEPDLYKALIELGVVYTKQGDFIKAIPFFEKALPLAKKDRLNYEIALYDLGKLYLYEGNVEKAWSYLNEAFRLKNCLGKDYWPDDTKDATYYIKHPNKSKFTECLEKTYPQEMHYRINRIRRIALFRPRAALQDCDNYLQDNPGSRFTKEILMDKAWILSGLKEYTKATEIITSLIKSGPYDWQKEWLTYFLYYNYFFSKQFDLAQGALQELCKNYSDYYSDFWCKYQSALIFKNKKDYNSEKEVLRDIIKSDSEKFYYLGQRDFSSLYYLEEAHRRLFEIYSVQGDYINAFLELMNIYTPFIFILIVISLVLQVGFLIGIFFVYSRVFFYQNIEALKKSKFRLRDLWLFWILILLLAPFFQILLFGFNYLTGNMLGKIGFDPLLIGNIITELLVVFLCVRSLKMKYQLDNQVIGFISKGPKYNLLLPVAVVLGFILFGNIYKYLLDKVFFLREFQHPLYDLIEQFKFQGRLTQKILLLITAVIFVPVKEEILYRVFLFLFLRQFSGMRSAIVISALVFSFGHEVPLLIPYYFVLGLVLNIIYLKTKSILPSIISHSLYNLSSLLCLLF